MDENVVKTPPAWKGQYDLVGIDGSSSPIFGVQQGPSVLVIHPSFLCEGRACVIHNPSDHHMREWSLNWRGDKGVMERTCPTHGVGHPDPDDAAYLKTQGREVLLIHGCCGCC